jgi:glucan phosphoethanolaminetransferase (alkaline phosphatase superfamily)
MKQREHTRTKNIWFIMLIALWFILTCLCYYRVIVFESTTIGGAMLFGFMLVSSVLSIIQMLKMLCDRTYAVLTEEND